MASWWGLRFEFTDGICRKCAARVQSERRRPSSSRPPVASKRTRASEIIVVALAVLTGLMLIARPANEGSGRFVEVTNLLPREVTIVRGSAEDPPPPSVRVWRPRPASRASTGDLREPRMRDRMQSP